MRSIKALLALGILISLQLPADSSLKQLKAAGIQPEIFSAFENYTFDSSEGFSTDMVLILKDGQKVYERYENGYQAGQRHYLWSMTKSFTSALVGLAIQQGKLDLTTPAEQFYPSLENREALTIAHLLHQSSGLSWNEGYEEGPFSSDVVRMLYLENPYDMADYVSKRPYATTPNSTFYYSSGNTTLLSGILKKAFADEPLEYPWRYLFDPLGITSAVWETDGSDTFVGSSYLYMSAEDVAKFGQLYLQKGLWEGSQILSSQWVENSMKVAPAFTRTTLPDARENIENYGRQWWLNLPNTEKNLPKPYPNAPDTIFMALGHHGQSLTVFPDQGIVLVRLASDKKARWDKDKAFKLLLESLNKEVK